MKVNKENMIKLLEICIDNENKALNDAPFDNIKEIEIYKMGYVRALKNLLFTISVNGE